VLDFAPGAQTPPHTHPGQVVGTVLAGEITFTTGGATGSGGTLPGMPNTGAGGSVPSLPTWTALAALGALAITGGVRLARRRPTSRRG
jgi:hypothetical protein